MKLNKAQEYSPAVVSRRAFFLNIFSHVIFGCLIAYLFYPVARFLIPPKDFLRNQDVVTLNASEVGVGGAKVINYKDKPTMVINTGYGLFALSAVCTHLGCIVQWDESRQEIICPCQGTTYDLNGNVKSGPAPKPLTIVKARMVGDKILIGMP